MERELLHVVFDLLREHQVPVVKFNNYLRLQLSNRILFIEVQNGVILFDLHNTPRHFSLENPDCFKDLVYRVKQTIAEVQGD